MKFTDRGEVRLDIQPAGPDVPPPVHSRLADMKAAKLIAFSVADTGTGISDGRLKVIFEAFTHAGDPAETRHVGPGLGLSISREIARLMDGEIHVASERGLGSVFTLYLPLISGGPMAHPELQDLPAPEGLAEGPVSAQAYGFSGQKVLIVDDDVRAAFGLTTDFERHGLEVLWAERVPQAIATVTADPEVAVVLLRLPTQGMSAGSAAASVIAQLAGPPQRPVIALARKATTLGREKALAAGASDYAATSLDGEQLLPSSTTGSTETTRPGEPPREGVSSCGTRSGSALHSLDERRPRGDRENQHRADARQLAVADGDQAGEAVGHLYAAAAVPIAVRGLPPGQAVHVCAHVAYSSATDSIKVRDTSGDSAAALARSYDLQ